MKPNKYVIFGDAGSDFSKDLRHQYEIEDPLTATIIYPDGHEEDNDPDWKRRTPEKYYREMASQKTPYKSSLPNPEYIRNRFESYLLQGFDILLITLSKDLSGTNEVANRIADELKERFPNNKIYVLDSRRYGGAIALIELKASMLRSEGKTLEETVEILEAGKNNIHQYGYVDDMFYLYKSGRISKKVALLGLLSSVKVIADFDSSTGLSCVIGKTHGVKKFFDLAPKYIESTVESPRDRIFIITYSNRFEQATKLKLAIDSTFNPRASILLPLGQFSGTSIGPGMCAVFYCGNEPVSPGCEKEKLLFREISKNCKN